MFSESVSKMKNGKLQDRQVRFLWMSEILKAAGEAEVDMITELANQIIAEGVIVAEWELSTIVNYYKGKSDSLEKENYRRLKLTDHILKTAVRITEELIGNR